MKTLILSTVCGLALLTVSTVQAGHPIARARVTNYRQAKAATRYAAAENYRAEVENLKANAAAARSAHEQAVEDLQTNVADLADQVRAARLLWFVIIKSEKTFADDSADGEPPVQFDGNDSE